MAALDVQLLEKERVEQAQFDARLRSREHAAVAGLEAELQAQTVPVLKDGLRARGLPLKGRKADLVSRLAWNAQLDRQQYAAIRRYVALFEHVRHEAIYLRLLELPPDDPRPEVLLSVVPSEERELVPAGESGAEKSEREQVVNEVMASLSPEDRSLLLLRHYEELTFKAIGEVIDCSARTAQNRVAAAAKRFQQELLQRRVQGGEL